MIVFNALGVKAVKPATVGTPEIVPVTSVYAHTSCLR